VLSEWPAHKAVPLHFNYMKGIGYFSSKLEDGVSNHWTGTVEWTLEVWCIADSTISHTVVASFIPFQSVRPPLTFSIVLFPWKRYINTS